MILTVPFCFYFFALVYKSIQTINKLNKKKIKVKILLRFDDITENMNWHLMDKCEKLFDEFNIKPVMGVIPNNEDKVLKAFPKREGFWKIVKDWQSKGWEISMHGYNHLYNQNTNKKDYFKYGGLSEFYGETLSNQSDKIKKGLEIFKKNQIHIRSFFAPNHTYDENTFIALKNSGIFTVIDGYGFRPFTHNKIKFIPQLFYKLFFFLLVYKQLKFILIL